MEKVKIGVLGLGAISGIYLKNLTQVSEHVQVLAVCDHTPEKAEQAAAVYGIPRVYRTFEEMLNDRDVEIVLNLTRPADHYRTTKAALLAGKNVYSEKPLAASYQEGEELSGLAADLGLLLGCAPDTFLGAGLGTCRKLVRDGAVGEIIGAEARMICHGHESWHPSPEFYYKKGGGPVMDMGPYYVTALVSLMGRVREVFAMSRKGPERRVIASGPKKGTVIDVEVPTYLSGVLRFESGAIASLMMTFDVYYDRQAFLELYGTKGTLRLPDPNGFGGNISLCAAGDSTFCEICPTGNNQDDGRGLGVDRMAAALRTGKSFEPDSVLALHVLEILTALELSGRDGRPRTIVSPYPAGGREDQ